MLARTGSVSFGRHEVDVSEERKCRVLVDTSLMLARRGSVEFR